VPDGDFSTCLRCVARLPRCGLRMARLVVADVGQQPQAGAPSSRVHSVGTRSFVPPRGPIRRGLRRPLCLANLLDGDLVIHLASQTCSTGTWSSTSLRVDLVFCLASQTCMVGTQSFASPHKLARRGIGHSSRHADLLDKWAEKELWALPWVPSVVP
jgi:hypothetical protein